MFWAGGDSLLVGPQSAASDSVFQVRVTSIDGTVRDSIQVAGPGLGLQALSVSPGGRWIVALVVQGSRGLWQVLDRSGAVADRVVNSCTCAGRITHDALWLTRSGQGTESIVRIGLDPATGRLAERQDTLMSGNFNNFSVTADGSTMVIEDGSPDYCLWALDLQDAVKGRFHDAAEGAELMWLDDGSLLFAPRDTPESSLLMKLAGPGKLTLLGRISRPNAGISISADLKRVSVVESNYHGDAFTSRIVRR
jgi:hypothetical protein